MPLPYRDAAHSVKVPVTMPQVLVVSLPVMILVIMIGMPTVLGLCRP
jgi:hypothetical protein